MNQDNTDGKRWATRKEFAALVEELIAQSNGDDDWWLAALGVRLREQYPGTYEGMLGLAREEHDDQHPST
jgi:hypothetical protein